ncbi:MAG: M28 family peptidase [Gemmatimonadota bacterium]|nr:M28 family peptidase [Gemmatimonadota bacterium]
MVRFPATALLAASLLLPAPGDAQTPELPGADTAASTIDADVLFGHTRFLSSDLLAGRGPGTRGDRLAQEYIAAEMETLGLEPAGPGGSWLQPFTLVGLTALGSPPLRLTGPDGETISLPWREEWIGSSGRQEARAEIEGAEVVFVGYGIVAPEEEWDDYGDVDVSGKVLLFLNNDPAGDRFGGEKRLYYGRWTYKYEIAAEKGAAAALVIHTTPSAGYPWQVVSSSWSGTQFQLPAGDEPRVAVEAWVTEEAARRLVALGGEDLDTLVDAAQSPDFTPVPLGVTAEAGFDVEMERTETANVLGRLPGSDPERKGEHVLFTAHYDHLGVGEPVEGDSIHNGARDNALGTASVLALARAYQALPEPPARSMLFGFVGAEEQGLLGSMYLAENPVVPNCDVVANINIDGGNIWGRTNDVRQIGRGKSTLDSWLDRFAGAQGREVLPEEFPDKGYYYRSDQFSFAKVGIPAIYLDEGTDFAGRPEGWGEERIAEWLETRYHQPSDEITPEWDLSGALQDDRLLFRVGYAVAESSDRPAWVPGDEFAGIRSECP